MFIEDNSDKTNSIVKAMPYSKVTLLHPFTPKAAGVVEDLVPSYHSQPHVHALQYLHMKSGVEVEIAYFTTKLSSYNFKHDGLTWRFFPVDWKFNGNQKKWRKQSSKNCLRHYKNSCPDITIINSSAIVSPFSADLAKVIKHAGKRYIAMLGGKSYADTVGAKEYYANAEFIIVHNRLQKAEMLQMPLFQDLRIEVLPLGVDVDLFRPLEVPKREKKIEFLFVGRITEYKRPHLAVEALNVLSLNGIKAVLKFVGPVSSKKYYEEIINLIEQYGLNTQVQWIETIPRQDLVSYFQQADVLLLPSHEETFGMVMIEAMACGTPVAGMKGSGGPADVITNRLDGLLSTPENYAQDILGLVSNLELLDAMRYEARATIEKSYSQDVTNTLFEKLLAEV